MSWLTVLVFAVPFLLGIARMVVRHFLACAKFATIRKAFPNESLEEVMKASKDLSSIDKNGN